MKGLRHASLGFAAGILALLPAEFSAAELAPPRPNFLLAIADDWSYGHAGAYGCRWVKTPAFDRVAKEGLLFTHAFTPNAKCAPSRACMLTGRNPWQLKAACNHIPFFPPEFKTYGEALSEQGYFVGMTAKGQAYADSNRLPLAILWKQGIRKPGRILHDYVSFIDFAPTFIELAGLEWAQTAMAASPGRSLTDLFYSPKSGFVNPARDHVLIGKERHDVGRPHDTGYPIRGIVKNQSLYLHNFETNRWPAGNPETGYLNCDGSPTKTEILNAHRQDTTDAHWALCFGKRPPEEFYDLRKDPDCRHNLAGHAAFQLPKARLKQQLFRALAAQQDPRMAGLGQVFEQYPYAHESERHFYERFTRGENIKAGWVNPTDFEKAPLDPPAEGSHEFEIAAPAGSKTSPSSAPFHQAEINARLAHEAFSRCRRYVDGWLAHTDPATDLIPRGLKTSTDFWNGRDAGADNYAFMVLTAAITDRPLLRGRLLNMLRTEQRITARVDRLVDDYSFAKQGWRREDLDLDATLFDSAEYVKDGLIPVTEWLGPSPWSQRMIDLVDDIWKHAACDTPFGKIPTRVFEVNGDLLQSCARLYWFTGDPKYLDWAVRLGDYYLLGTNHPTRNLKELRLRDHGCEVINGLTELYVAAKYARPDKAEVYRKPLREIFDRILEIGRNEHGLLYDWINPRTGAHSPGICDTWGYDYDGFYSLFLLDQVVPYRDAVLKALGNLKAHYINHPWEGQSADGYADSIEGAINLYHREPVASAAEWIDSEILVMWAKQQPDGIIEGWHGDGNFARTSLMYALWKTQGVTLQPWRADLRFGAVRDHNGSLFLSLSADQSWKGKVMFDRPRHRDFLHLPLDYPRINQFPEWFAVQADSRYAVSMRPGARPTTRAGHKLTAGLPLKLKAGDTACWTVKILPSF